MSETERFHQLAGEYFEEGYRAVPILATELGIHTYDHLLGDYSEQGLRALASMARGYGERLASIRPESLSPYDQIDHALVEMDIRNTIREVEKIGHWRTDPTMYVEYPLIAVFLLIAREFAPLEERMKSVLERLKRTPGVLAEGKANIKDPPQVFVQIAIETAEGGLQFYGGLIPAMAAQVPTLQNEILAASEDVLAALKDYLAWLKETLLPRAQGNFAIGAELFNELLRENHMLDLTADRLGAIGRDLMRTTKGDLETLARQIAPGKAWPDIVAEARNHHPSGEKLLETYRTELAKLKGHIRDKDLVSIPENEELEVTETPVFNRSVIPYAAYMPPAAFEKQQKGQFWVTPLDTAASPEAQMAQLQEHCYANFPITALHEAYPGHHLQLVFSNNVSSSIRRRTGHSSLFVEGWALYCEQLMGDTGYYDPIMKLFQLKDQLWRAVRIVIDVGLHCQGVTVEEAVRLLMDEVHPSEAAARSEVKRYTQTPTQPSTYLLGKLEILKLREKAKGVPLRRFHDALLSSGSIPFRLVERELWGRLK